MMMSIVKSILHSLIRIKDSILSIKCINNFFKSIIIRMKIKFRPILEFNKLVLRDNERIFII